MKNNVSKMLLASMLMGMNNPMFGMPYSVTKHYNAPQYTCKGYGKISADKYNDLLTKGKEPIELKETLREDYSFNLDDNILSINYSCGCSVCKFHFEYKQDVTVY